MDYWDWDSFYTIPLTGIAVGNAFDRTYGEPSGYSDMASLKAEDELSWIDSARWPEPLLDADLDRMENAV